ncbi:hypothetical protein J6590_058793 [Homalodisca vitripennis]|nr:hypothetical protein J6590_058793 [Homalodisca vitripennis]
MFSASGRSDSLFMPTSCHSLFCRSPRQATTVAIRCSLPQVSQIVNPPHPIYAHVLSLSVLPFTSPGLNSGHGMFSASGFNSGHWMFSASGQSDSLFMLTSCHSLYAHVLSLSVFMPTSCHSLFCRSPRQASTVAMGCSLPQVGQIVYLFPRPVTLCFAVHLAKPQRWP